jgi:hypothetical protein
MLLVSCSLAARQLTRRLRRAFAAEGHSLRQLRGWSIDRQSASAAKGVPARDGVALAHDREEASRGSEGPS